MHWKRSEMKDAGKAMNVNACNFNSRMNYAYCMIGYFLSYVLLMTLMCGCAIIEFIFGTLCVWEKNDEERVVKSYQRRREVEQPVANTVILSINHGF